MKGIKQIESGTKERDWRSFEKVFDFAAVLTSLQDLLSSIQILHRILS